jgi:hypothetical protein
MATAGTTNLWWFSPDNETINPSNHQSSFRFFENQSSANGKNSFLSHSNAVCKSCLVPHRQGFIGVS